jgi:hypothetical protein
MISLNCRGRGGQASGSNVRSTKRKDPQKLINNVRIEYLDRAAGYIPNEIDHKDEAAIQRRANVPATCAQNISLS